MASLCLRPIHTEVLPLLYLHGLSSLDFVPALGGFFGAAAAWGAETRSCSWPVLVNQATEQVTSVHVAWLSLAHGQAGG
jgi:hypothetical protein